MTALWLLLALSLIGTVVIVFEDKLAQWIAVLMRPVSLLRRMRRRDH
ncbi:hypothetical protein GCM10012275_28540 [Longimycelium tulufanense]|uniref:Uncharacterized protein n=1 Tax=Longimycelium tulufanense TaxID=907463 RepID=A0A8J3C8G3_9PSEU|nr:hypothetical protein [Longimycelium tulufanense]GGM55722.1 hypothetical protein GCM10012275_28540 [Longimycelium tulufanense]